MKTKRPATYQDVLDAPEHMVAELIDDELFLWPRPAGPHTLVGSYLGGELHGPFSRGRGGPGGWLILDEPELHLGKKRVCVPDLAGWRRERMSTVPDDHQFTIAPDWVCEVASRSTEKFDRAKKLPIYAAAGIRHAWLVHPGHRTLEVLRLVDGNWMLVGIYADNETVRAEPFDAIELDLATLWKDLPVRASEGYLVYGEAPY
jgi:Uma2 family endonuclease